MELIKLRMAPHGACGDDDDEDDDEDDDVQQESLLLLLLLLLLPRQCVLLLPTTTMGLVEYDMFPFFLSLTFLARFVIKKSKAGERKRERESVCVCVCLILLLLIDGSFFQSSWWNKFALSESSSSSPSWCFSTREKCVSWFWSWWRRQSFAQNKSRVTREWTMALSCSIQ